MSEHPDLKEFLSLAKEYDGTITLSSLRLDVLDDELLESLKVSNYKTITIAPEAGTHRLRNVINKDITDEKIFSLVENARNKGFERIKLYYLIGLPTETMEDIEAIGTSALKLIETLQHKARGKVILSINPFIPKPFTPFQWHKMDDLKTLDTKIKLIKEITKKENGIEIKALSPKSAYLEALLSNSGREISSFIEEASRVGWKSALKNIDEGIKNKVFENREFDDSLPWDIIDAGIEKDYLWAEYEKSLKGIETEPCDVGSCFRCGVC